MSAARALCASAGWRAASAVWLEAVTPAGSLTASPAYIVQLGEPSERRPGDKYSFAGVGPAPTRRGIVSYRSKGLLGECLRSLGEHPAGGGMTVRVVDNASGDETAEMVRREFPEASLTVSPRNVHFAAASNLAIRGGSAPFVLRLNPDTRVTPGAPSVTVIHSKAGSSGPVRSPRLNYAFDYGTYQALRGDRRRAPERDRLCGIRDQPPALGDAERDQRPNPELAAGAAGARRATGMTRWLHRQSGPGSPPAR